MHVRDELPVARLHYAAHHEVPLLAVRRRQDLDRGLAVRVLEALALPVDEPVRAAAGGEEEQ